ncbi:hypothetical protein EBR96_02065 [bacterium]|nr:hypothetical protein [bacterium]
MIEGSAKRIDLNALRSAQISGTSAAPAEKHSEDHNDSTDVKKASFEQLMFDAINMIEKEREQKVSEQQNSALGHVHQTRLSLDGFNKGGGEKSDWSSGRI